MNRKALATFQANVIVVVVVIVVCWEWICCLLGCKCFKVEFFANRVSIIVFGLPRSGNEKGMCRGSHWSVTCFYTYANVAVINAAILMKYKEWVFIVARQRLWCSREVVHSVKFFDGLSSFEFECFNAVDAIIVLMVCKHWKVSQMG